MGEWNIIGHEWAIRRLRREIEADQLAQSHLFTGPPSVGKAALARAMAREVLSRTSADPARARRLVDQLKHPDLTWLGLSEGESSVRIAEVRNLIHTLTLAPVEGRYRVAVVDDAHLATDESQNAILKTLEEPNPTSIIVLIATNTDRVLPTIVSRCQVLNLRPVPTPVLTSALVERGAPEERAAFLAGLARGRPGWALRAAEDGGLLERRTQRLTDLETLVRSSYTRRLQYSEALARSGDEAQRETLEEWLFYWRDVARVNGTAGDLVSGDNLATIANTAIPVHNADHVQAIKAIAEEVPVGRAVTMLRLIMNALTYLQQNARPQLVLDALLLQMPML